MQLSLLPIEILALVPSVPPFVHYDVPYNSGANKTSKRRLFQYDEQANSEINQQYVKRLISELAEEHKQKWDFDFMHREPICASSSISPKFHYWEASSAEVPRFYTPKSYSLSKNRRLKYNSTRRSCNTRVSIESSEDSSEVENQSTLLNSSEEKLDLSSDYSHSEEENIHPLNSQSKGCNNYLPSPVKNTLSSRKLDLHKTPKKPIFKQSSLTDFMSICKRSNSLRSVDSKILNKTQNSFSRIENKTILKKSRKNFNNLLHF